MNRGAVRPWIILALIFVLGAATGSLLTIGLAPRSGPPGPQEMREHWMRHLVWRLHLTDEQQAKIAPILTDAETRILAAHRDDVARISSIMKAANADIRPYLNPDQQTELQRMESERERMFNGHTHGHGPPFDAHEAPDHSPGPSPPAPAS